MRKASKSTGGPGTSTKGAGKTTVRSTMTPVFAAGKGRASAKRLKGRAMAGR